MFHDCNVETPPGLTARRDSTDLGLFARKLQGFQVKACQNKRRLLVSL